MTTAARQHSHPALKKTERSRSVRRKLARLRHIHPPSHTQHLALVEEVRAGRRSKYVRDPPSRLSAAPASLCAVSDPRSGPE